MNTDCTSFALNEVTIIINSSLSKKLYKSQVTELQRLITQFGFECERQVFRHILSGIISTNDGNRLALLQQLLVDLDLFALPNWTTLLDSGLKGCASVNVLTVAKCLRLSDSKRAALSVATNSEQTKLIPGDCEQLEDIVLKSDLNDLNHLTHFVFTQTNSENRNLYDKLRKELKLPSDSINSRNKFLHLPFAEVFDHNTMDALQLSASGAANLTEDQIAGMLVNENSNTLTAEFLRQFNVTPKLCAKILCAICESPLLRQSDSGQLHRFEEIDQFADVCREILTSASPLTEIIQVIDEESFINNSNKMFNTKIHNKTNPAFQKFWQFCINLCTTDKQGIHVLGMTFFGKFWNKNVEFQFGFIVHCIKNQLISKLLSGSPSGPGPGGGDGLIEQIVPHLDSLKCQPDFESTAELNTWKYQRLYQMLIEMSNINSNSNSIGTLFYSQILELFKWPLQQCPDLVTLGLLGCNNTPTVVKNEVLSLAIPSFLGNHPNAAIVLHSIWTSSETPSTTANNSHNWAKQILLLSMCDYYMKSPIEEQQQRLSRILDVAQDLKALSLLLNGNMYPFVIDLACLASRREYLKLDKWLMDKIECNGENFVNACASFLSRRCTVLNTSNAIESANVTQQSNLPNETLAIMLSCLQQIVNTAPNTTPVNCNISQDLKEQILTMIANSSRFITKPQRQAPPGVISTANTQRQVTQQPPIGDLGLSNLNINPSSESPSAPFVPAIRPPINLPNLAPQPPPPPGGVMQNPSNPDKLRQVVGDLASIFPEIQHNVSIEIEEEADTYFQRIYNHSQSGSLSIDEVLDMLRRFQDSSHRREREVFTCMIRNLFKEYGFFPQYPERELMITAQLFGGIIQMGLVKYMALVVALRYVLEALRKPLNSKMYFFGIHALKRFKTKLKDYPLYCQHLASIPHFRNFPTELIEYIECGAQSQEPPASGTRPPLPSLPSLPHQQSLIDNGSLTGIIGSNAPQSAAMPPLGGMIHIPGNVSNVIGSNINEITNQPIAPPTRVLSTQMTSIANITPVASSISSTPSTSRPSIANNTNIDTLLAAGESMYQIPPEATQDKVAFIINNLSQVNLPQKTEEFKEILGKDDQYIGWIAQYFVMKRASIEPNFHSLYANFIEMLKMNELIRLVLKETHRNIKVLLRSDKGIANFSDRSLLKNLGHWLGMLTLAKNKPILAIDLDLKSLLIEAYHKGTQELLYVVPFIAKILESAAKSKIFKPPNPWTIGIIRALVELHQEPNLKLNLKFEVEVLCKALNIELSNYIGKSNTLKNEDVHSRIEHQLGSGLNGSGGGSGGTVVGGGSGGVTIKLSQPSLVIHDQISTSHAAPSPVAQIAPPHLPIVSTPSAVASSSGVHPFNYNEINITSVAGLSQHIIIQQNLPLFNVNPILKQFVRPAIERAVQEWIIPVVERSMKISLTTAEQIIKKDFALDPDENRMCLAAHHLTRNLTAGMAMITCKDPLFISITNGLKSAFTAKCPSANKESIEVTAHTIATDNIDLACCFIQKTAIEKSIPEIDRKLKNEYEIRRAARSEGRRYCDPTVLTYQAERMPESIRLKVGPVTAQQMNVYEELGKNIPGFNSLINDSNSSVSLAVVTTSSGNAQLNSGPSSTSSMNQFKLSNAGLASLANMSTVSGGQSAAGMASLSSGFGSANEPPVPPQAADAALITIYEKLMTELENLMHQFHQAMQPNILLETIRSIAETLIMARQNPRDIVYALNLIQKVLDAIAELLVSVETGVADMVLVTRARDLYLVILKALSDPRAFTHQWTTKQITRVILDRLLNNSNSGSNLPDELLETLIRSSLVNFQLMDINLSQLIEGASSPAALQFIFQFFKIYGQSCNESEFPNTIDSLLRLSKTISNTNIPLFTEIQQVIDIIRGAQPGPMGVGNDTASGMLTMHSGMGQTREFDADPPGLLEKTERLLREWIQLYHSTANPSKIFQFYVQQMNLQTDDLITRFFRLSTEMCVELCYRILTAAAQQPGSSNLIDVRSKCFHTLDAFTHLIVMLVKHSGSSNAASGAASETTAKLNLLNKVLGIIAGVATQDQDLRQAEFQHLPYYRIFVLLFMELVLGPANLGLPGSVLMHSQMGLNPNQLDPLLESVQYQVLTAFCNTLHMLRPTKAPSFSFAWLDFISHRTFMEKCLYSGNMNAGAITKGWPMYAQLLVDLIKFEAPFLRNVDLPQSIDLLYKGTLKVFLVLLHDFPEFLCEYCYNLCDVIPCNAIQMRNLVLSAFPRNMRLPDPFTPNLKIDSLPEISQPPKGTATFAALGNQSFKKDLDSYLRTRSPVAFLSDLRGYLQTNPNQNADSNYNIPLINALILYVGQTAIQTISPKNINMSSIAHSSHMDIFQNLAVALDTEGRYLFLNAIANQLRYPNSHTHYFSCTLLYLFAESNTEAIQEQITRVLLERLIVNRPHPWGLLVTFIELIKNPTFKFWNHEFVRCAPEIEKLFDSVARSCNNNPNYKSSTSGGPQTAENPLLSQSNPNA